MKQREIKHLKKGAVGIVLLVCVICYSAGGCREQDRTKDYGVFGKRSHCRSDSCVPGARGSGRFGDR